MTKEATTVGLIGCGYWGPNLLRNFSENEAAELRWICDLDPKRLEVMGRRYPSAETTRECERLLADPRLDAVVISTPVGTHYDYARRALAAGKHVLVEKPLTASVREAEELIALAEAGGLTLMVDHTFIYTGAVRKIKEIVEGGGLGDLLYFDSTRINLGLFQPDINVVWDLAPHDLSIMDYILDRRPTSVSATGSCHIRAGIENIAYVMLRFPEEFIAHFHFNWLAPVKIRRTLIAGTRKMIVYDDIEPVEKVRVYDSGVTASRAGGGDAVAAEEEREAAYRTPSATAPATCGRPARHDRGARTRLPRVPRRRARAPRAAHRRPSGLRVVRLLEARRLPSSGAASRRRLTKDCQ